MEGILRTLGNIYMVGGTIGNFILSYFLSRKIVYQSSYRVEYEFDFKMYLVWLIAIELLIITETAILHWMDSVQEQLRNNAYYIQQLSEKTESQSTKTDSSYSIKTPAPKGWECPVCSTNNPTTALFCKGCGKDR